MPKPPDDDPVFEFRVVSAPLCRLIVGWTFPSADASALISTWHRDGFRYGSAALAPKWKVAYVALKDPAAEADADAWYAAYSRRRE